jgi:hypothetical protein
VNFAEKAVIFSKGQPYNLKKGKEEMIDAASIFIYKSIKKQNKNIQIMIELVYSKNLEFLYPDG